MFTPSHPVQLYRGGAGELGMGGGGGGLKSN